MRGHWISGTRKLNRHYQSGGVKSLALDDMELFLVTSITYGIDDVFVEQLAPAPGRSIPASIANAEKIEYKMYAQFNDGTGDLYLHAIRFQLLYEDSEGNDTTKIINFCTPEWTTWEPYTALNSTSFTNLYGNADHGEQFTLDSETGLLKLSTRFIFDKTALGVSGQKLKSISIYWANILSNRLTRPTTATLVNRSIEVVT